MELMREYCLGDGNVSFEIVSDRKWFRGRTINFERPDLNVRLPIFMIHGNHDDPTGLGNLSALDILQSAGLINYFGSNDDLENIQVSPVLFKKGNSQLALYGLGNVRDERLHRALQHGQVSFLVPGEDASTSSQWFNLMMIHQNRHKGAAGGIPSKNCVHESMLPNFLDLVVWGHEHDSHPVPWETSNSFHLMQPGSSIVTSLTQGESLPKHITLLEVDGDNFRVTPIPLKTSRPLIYHELSLENCIPPVSPLDDKAVFDVLMQKARLLLGQYFRPDMDEEALQAETIAFMTNTMVNATIGRTNKSQFTQQAASNNHRNKKGNAGAQNINVASTSDDPLRSHVKLMNGSTNRKTELPLLRIRVDLTGGFTPIANHRFALDIAGLVANPDDVLSFSKRSIKKNKADLASKGLPLLEVAQEEDIESGRNKDDMTDKESIQDLIFHSLANGNNHRLFILPEPLFNEAVQSFVHKSDPHAIDEFIKHALNSAKIEICSKISNQQSSNFTCASLLTPQDRSQVKSLALQRADRIRDDIVKTALEAQADSERLTTALALHHQQDPTTVQNVDNNFSRGDFLDPNKQHMLVAGPPDGFHLQQRATATRQVRDLRTEDGDVDKKFIPKVEDNDQHSSKKLVHLSYEEDENENDDDLFENLNDDTPHATRGSSAYEAAMKAISGGSKLILKTGIDSNVFDNSDGDAEDYADHHAPQKRKNIIHDDNSENDNELVTPSGNPKTKSKSKSKAKAKRGAQIIQEDGDISNRNDMNEPHATTIAQPKPKAKRATAKAKVALNAMENSQQVPLTNLFSQMIANRANKNITTNSQSINQHPNFNSDRTATHLTGNEGNFNDDGRSVLSSPTNLHKTNPTNSSPSRTLMTKRAKIIQDMCAVSQDNTVSKAVELFSDDEGVTDRISRVAPATGGRRWVRK